MTVIPYLLRRASPLLGEGLRACGFGTTAGVDQRDARETMPSELVTTLTQAPWCGDRFTMVKGVIAS